MCEPVSIGTIAAVTLAGGAMKAVSDRQAASAMANRDTANAILADQAASDALQRGESDAARVQMQGSALGGAQRVGYAGSGVRVGAGSTERTAEDTAGLTTMDMMTVRNNAQREAWGLETQSSQFREKSSNENASGWIQAGSDIISSATSAEGNFTQGAPRAPGT